MKKRKACENCMKADKYNHTRLMVHMAVSSGGDSIYIGNYGEKYKLYITAKLRPEKEYKG